MRNIWHKGFILPATIMLGLGIAIISTTYLQFTATTSVTLSSRNFNALASEAARAGITYANSCIEANANDWTELTPMKACNGTTNGSTPYLTSNNEYRTTFSVDTPVKSNGTLTIVSTGIVERLNSAGQKVDTIRKKIKTTMPDTFNEYPVATGTPITKIRNDATDCAIANGDLYCWGVNTYGTVGDGTTTNRANPTKVQGALAGKTVTDVSVSISAVCAIADGEPYCWGSNSANQLGSGGGSVKTPTANVPRTSSGPLAGKIITEISTASWNNPAQAIWLFATSFEHSCALTAEGAVACWGYGEFRQLTGGGPVEICVIICVPTGFYDYPSYTYPTLIKGYSDNTGPFAGKRALHVGASSHDSCLLAEGKLYCMGVRAPIDLWCNSVLFSAASLTLVPLNPCVANYSNGYEPGGALSGKLVDPESWNLSANETCLMAHTSLVCFGTTPAFGLFWIDSWGEPWVARTDVDVTYADNGDNINSMGLTGLFCYVDRGKGRCAGQPGNIYTGTGSLGGWVYFVNLNESSGLAGKVATAIAAGEDHGCVVANGQLLCWGDGSYGKLADGSTALLHTKTYPTVTGTGGSTPIGTTEGTYAATGPISTGEGHSCAVVNGQIYCWGKNNYGQLGIGSTDEKYSPIALPSMAGKVFTKVSAGANHTCGISDGRLYCWGLNSNGQLGIGNTTNYSTPQLVTSFGGTPYTSVRVTEVSAGATGTCAIANSQAYCWGLNSSKQVGDGTTTQRTSPVAVSGGGGVLTGKAVTSISMGVTHACAVANSDIYCWGDNSNGRTGKNTATGTSDPSKLTGGSAGTPKGPNNMNPNATMVSAGYDFTCAIINANVSCWGNNANGRTGLNTTSGNQLVPARISGSYAGYYTTAVSAGGSHACALMHGGQSRINGNVFCWGNGASGRLGNNVSSGDFPSAVRINGGHLDEGSTTKSSISVSAGESSTCVVAKGTVVCWGNGTNGRLGNNAASNRLTPTTTSSYKSIVPYQKGPIF